MKIEVVDVLKFEEKRRFLHDNDYDTENYLEFYDKDFTENGLKEFLISLYNLSEDSILKENLSVYIGDNKEGCFTIKNKYEIITAEFKLIKALNIDGKYYKLEELNI